MKDVIEQHVERVIESQTAGRLQRLLQSDFGLWIIAAISFFESALPVPLITDPFMMAAILADRSRALYVVIVTTISSIVGGIAAFAMAAYSFELVSGYMTAEMHEQFNQMLTFGGSDTFFATLTGAITPVPYTLTAWVIAVAGGSLFWFFVASVIGRTARYAIVGYCTYFFGPVALKYIRRYVAALSLLVLIAVVGYLLLRM